MPGTVTTIDRDQREGLYELVRNHLGSIEKCNFRLRFVANAA